MRNSTPHNVNCDRSRLFLMRLEERYAPGTMFGDTLSAAILAQVAGLMNQPSDVVAPSSSLMLVNQPPADAAPSRRRTPRHQSIPA